MYHNFIYCKKNCIYFPFENKLIPKKNYEKGFGGEKQENLRIFNFFSLSF